MNLPFTTFIFFCLFVSVKCDQLFAQIDLQCNGRDLHSIYLVSHTDIYRIDSVDTNPTNPVLLAACPPGVTNGGGISINNNLDSINGPETMYFVYSGINYNYWNGSGWTDTGHSSGHLGATNIGGTSSYIFNLVGSSGSIYRYDGSGNGTFLVSNLNASGVLIYDIATDNQGNFYLCNSTTNKIIAYNSNGIPIDSFTTTNGPTNSDCGFVIVGNRFYYGNCNLSLGLYEGIKSGNNINFTLIKSLSIDFRDMAACPNAANPLAIINDPELPLFAVYPNPTNKFVTIKLDNVVRLEISDYMGVLVKAISVKGVKEYFIDVSDWKAGVYFITVLAANKTSRRSKIIVQ